MQGRLFSAGKPSFMDMEVDYMAKLRLSSLFSGMEACAGDEVGHFGKVVHYGQNGCKFVGLQQLYH